MRTILHCDMNSFYASVECIDKPELAGKPMAVCGDPELRHGIILAKTPPAKACGVSTGEPILRALKKCPSLILIPANMEKYSEYSFRAHRMFKDYSDFVEPFGMDEAWIDTSVWSLEESAKVADELRSRIKNELKITASVGVSFNKIFAKLGSDMKKPDATTVISPENYRQSVWPLPVEELLFVGPATTRKLRNVGIFTIGQLAFSSVEFLRSILGKWGDTLHAFAAGLDASPVAPADYQSSAQTIGNSTTTARDLFAVDEVKLTLFLLSEKVAARLRQQKLVCHSIQLSIRDCELNSYERQCPLPCWANTSDILADASLHLFVSNHPGKAVRSLGVRACDLKSADTNFQLSFLPEDIKRIKRYDLETAIDNVRKRYGKNSVQRAVMLTDRQLSGPTCDKGTLFVPYHWG